MTVPSIGRRGEGVSRPGGVAVVTADGTAALMHSKTSALRVLDSEGRRKGEMQKLPDPTRTFELVDGEDVRSPGEGPKLAGTYEHVVAVERREQSGAKER